MALRGFWSGVRNILVRGRSRHARGGFEAAFQPQAVKAGVAAHRLERRRQRRSGYLDPAAFVQVMNGLGRREAAERLHVVSLSDFRDAAGAKWPRLSRLVGVATEQIIRRHLDMTRDFYTQLDEETAVVVLPQTDRKVARSRVTAIAKDLTSHLCGSGLLSGRRPQVVMANVSLGEAMNADGGINDKVIADAVAGASPALEPPSDGGTVSSTKVAAISGGDEPHPAKGDMGWVEMHRTKPAEQQPADNGPVDVLAWLTAQTPETAAAQAPAPEQRHPLAEDTSLTLVWTPTWVTSINGIGAFHARVIRTDEGEDGFAAEGVQAYAGLTDVEILTLDRFVATQAARELKAIQFANHKIGITVPFHWTSLAARWRDCIRIPFEDCSPATRRRFLKVEIFGLTPEVPKETLRDLLSPLELLGCDVMVRLPMGAPELATQINNVRAIGVDLAELRENERSGDDQLFTRLAHFRKVARDNKMASYVWSVRRRPMVGQLVTGGFSLVNGPGIMCDVAHPLPINRLRAAVGKRAG